MNLVTKLYNQDSFESKIKILKENKSIIKEYDIETILNTFACITTPKEAMEVANIFKELNGNLIVCHAASWQKKEFITIIDQLQGKTFYYYIYVKKYKKLLQEAFGTLGYKSADHYSLDQLYKVYSKGNLDIDWIFSKYPQLKTKYINEFFDGLHLNKPFNDRLRFLKDSDLKLQILPEPEMIIDAFSDATKPGQAIRVTKAIYNKFKTHVIVCREASFKQGEYMTIMDVIQSIDRTWKEKPSRQLFIDAFHKIGLQKAKDSNYKKMRDEYCECVDYCTKLADGRYGRAKGIMAYVEYPKNDLLYDQLDITTNIDQYVSVLRNSDWSFSNMVKPSIYLPFIDNEMIFNEDEITFDHAIEIASIFKQRFGLIMISKMDSYYEGQYMTIMDELEMLIDCRIGDHILHLFYKAFDQLGFKNARDCDPIVLKHLQTCNGNYDYEEMKNTNSWLLEAITMECYKPYRIQKWINAGNDVEDYMNY